MKELNLFKEDEKWYTLEQIAELCGYELSTLQYGEANLSAIMNKMSINIEVNTRLGGYHNTQKFYSENVLKALKEYQLKNSVPNAVKNKETVISGNISLVQNQSVKQAIDNLLDNPATLNMLLTESLERSMKLGIENKQLKDIIEEQAPKVEYHDRLVSHNHLTSIRDTAKELEIPERMFIEALICRKWLFRDKSRKLKAFSEKVKDGLLEEKDWENNGHSGIQVFVTVKGKERLMKSLKEAVLG